MSDAEVLEVPEAGDVEREEQERREAIEAEARRQGWRPKDEYSGKSGAWVDAEEYVERGKQMASTLRRENADLVRQLSEMQQRQKESAEIFDQFREYQTQTEQRAYARARRELEAQRDNAVAAGNTDEFKRRQAELDEMDRDRPAPPAPARKEDQQPASQPQQAQVPPEVTQWVKDNPWFESDPDAEAYARAIDVRLTREQPHTPLRDRLAETRRLVAKRFPEHFGNPRREAPSAVGSPNNGERRVPKKGPTYDDLPAEAKKACDKFVKQGLLSKEDYVASYQWDAA